MNFQDMIDKAVQRRQAQSNAETNAAVEVVKRSPARHEPQVLDLSIHMQKALSDCFEAGGVLKENKEPYAYGRSYIGKSGAEVYIGLSVSKALCARGLMRWTPEWLCLTSAGSGLAALGRDKLPFYFYITLDGEVVYGDRFTVETDLNQYISSLRQSVNQKTKAEVKRQCSALLAKWKERGDIDDEKDVAFLHDLIGGHINAAHKIGVGVEAFFVAPATYGTYCFHIRRRDGSVTDFGISACLDDARRLNLVSLRAVVEMQVYDYRAKFTGPTFVSEFSGETFPIDQLHIDHVTPFLTIVDKFATKEGLNLSVLWTDSKDMSFQPVWLDEKVPKAFAGFHAGFKLRAVSRFENLSTIRRKANAQAKVLCVKVQ